jgi:hypothetical protein
MRHVSMFNARALEVVVATLAILASGAGAFGQTKAPAAQEAKNRAVETAGCGSAAFLTLEHGKLAAVDWVERTGNRIHTRGAESVSDRRRNDRSAAG